MALLRAHSSYRHARRRSFASQRVWYTPSLLLRNTEPYYSWLPIEPLSYCITHTQCRVLICDPERSAVIQPVVDDLAASGVAGFLVFGDTVEVNAQWAGMQSCSSVVQRFSKETDNAILEGGHDYLDVDVQPEDNCAVMFTSGEFIHEMHFLAS